jgi:2-C-methyl-D-erythritol 4-phosphate cytidylyltransferase
MESGAALLAIPVADTVKQSNKGKVSRTVSRDNLYLAQTPQVFPYAKILSLHAAYAERSDAAEITDDVSLAEGNGLPVRIVEPNGPNFKLTTPRDLAVIEAILEREQRGGH